ncbi:MAG: TonB-dependent receptor plug domain-containing protein [Cellvibrionaceae bacterium]
MLYCSLAIPAISYSQEAKQTIDEVVVTGSFIKREKFDMASPVETISADDIQTSGYTDVGPYIRDLTYTANVDTVANVLATGDGQQDSNSAMFNLRGLGTSSTLTLFDGRRVLNSGAVGSILPDIATKRVEVILDGGAATYGTDAVAGVVNLIPDKDYEGFKVRGFYTTDEEGDVPESKAAFKWGSALTDKLHVVFSAEYSERKDALYRSDRPKYLAADNDSSISGNPGNFSSPTGANWGNDPECGTYNGTNTNDALAGSYPSGASAFGGFICTFEYGEYQDFKRPNQDFKTLITAVYDYSSSLSFELIYSLDKYESLLITSPSTAERSSNDTLTISAAHPNWPTWPFAQTTSRTPRNWRPFTDNGSTSPSFLDDRGANNDLYYYETEMLSLGSKFELGNTGWGGSAWYTSASSEDHIKGYELSRSRLRSALQGNGGPDGNQWFNPFHLALQVLYHQIMLGVRLEQGLDVPPMTNS